ncbi:MAG: hypothetical protein HGA51_10275, partial [Demequinaceae bacterium]|nr:hypothetical protein [Demequinaceae bacterium]
LSARVGKYVTKLLKAIKELLPRLDDAARLFRSLRKALDDALASGSNAIRTAVRKADDAAHALPTPSPAIRAPHAPARTADDTFLDLVESGRAEVLGYRPTYRDDVDSVVTLFDARIKDMIVASDAPTLGRSGTATFVMPADDADLISSIEDAVVATGAAPSIDTAWREGREIFGLEVPADSLDLRVPTRTDAGNFRHFMEGGYTAINKDGLFSLNRVRELVIDGGVAMPPGTVLFQLMRDGARMPIRSFP